MPRKLLIYLIFVVLNLRAAKGAREEPSKKEQNPEKAVLELGGSFSITSDPLPPLIVGTTDHSSSTRETLLKSFGSDPIRDLLISGGGNQRLYHETMSPKYLQLWKDKCDEIPNAHSPAATGSTTRNEALLVTEVEIRFPGLCLVTKSLTGVQFLVDARTGLPQYEYCLLAQKQVPSGNSLAVKMFNQLTGEGNRSQDSDDLLHPVSGTSLSRASLIETSAETDSALAIHFDCWVHLEYSFPAMLLRLLPIAKPRLEKMISGGIVKKARKEVTKGIEAARKVMLVSIGDSKPQRKKQNEL